MESRQVRAAWQRDTYSNKVHFKASNLEMFETSGEPKE